MSGIVYLHNNTCSHIRDWYSTKKFNNFSRNFSNIFHIAWNVYFNIPLSQEIFWSSSGFKEIERRNAKSSGFL